MATQTPTKPTTVTRLWVDAHQGRIVCDAHAGHHLGHAIRADKAGRRRKVTTDITTWEAFRTDDRLHPADRAALVCEDCGATLGPDPRDAAFALVNTARDRALAAHRTITTAETTLYKIAADALRKGRFDEATEAAQTLIAALDAKR